MMMDAMWTKPLPCYYIISRSSCHLLSSSLTTLSLLVNPLLGLFSLLLLLFLAQIRLRGLWNLKTLLDSFTSGKAVDPGLQSRTAGQKVTDMPE
jgi:hypothetical protein